MDAKRLRKDADQPKVDALKEKRDAKQPKVDAKLLKKDARQRRTQGERKGGRARLKEPMVWNSFLEVGLGAKQPQKGRKAAKSGRKTAKKGRKTAAKGRKTAAKGPGEAEGACGLELVLGGRFGPRRQRVPEVPAQGRGQRSEREGQRRLRGWRVAEVEGKRGQRMEGLAKCKGEERMVSEGGWRKEEGHKGCEAG